MDEAIENVSRYKIKYPWQECGYLSELEYELNLGLTEKQCKSCGAITKIDKCPYCGQKYTERYINYYKNISLKGE
jgi:hypothetical protein